MKTVSIGRRSSNEVSIKDPLVSRDQHCLITEENGHYYIFDANSTNGTYVNGSRIPNAVKMPLNKSDVVRIGNTVLPWQSYFPPSGGGSGNGGSDGGNPQQQPTTTALQAIALVLSLVGLCCVGYVAIKILSWGIVGYVFNYTMGLVGAGCSLVALILAKIAEYQEESDNTTMASIAEWISSACLFAVVAFFIAWKINPDLLNPLANIH